MEPTIRSAARIVLSSRAEPLTRLHRVAAVLAGTTGIVHLYLYWAQEFLPFLLAALGFFGAVALLAVGVNRRLLYVVGVPFTGVQVIAWVLVGMPDFALGVVDKTVEIALIVALVILFVTDRRALRARETAPARTDSDPVAPAAAGR